MATEREETEYVKISFIGPAGSGKTALTKVLGGQVFSKTYKSTIGADFGFLEKKNTKFQIWDTAGQVKFSPPSHKYLEGSEAIYIVLNSANLPTLAELQQWITRAQENASHAAILLVFNKTDLLIDDKKTEFDQKSPKLIETFRKVNNDPNSIVYCSAKTQDGIERLKTKIISRPGRFVEEDEVVIGKYREKYNHLLVQPSFKTFLNRFWDEFQVYFGTSNAVRNSLTASILGLIGLVLVGAFSVALIPELFISLMVISGSIAALGALAAVVCGIASFVSFKESDYRKALFNSKSMTKALLSEFIRWMQSHLIDYLVGGLLFGTTVAMIVMAVFFPEVLSATMLFLMTAINFVGSGFVGIGLVGMPAMATAFFAAALIGVTAIVLWDVVCRIGHAIFSGWNEEKKTNEASTKEDQPTSKQTEKEEQEELDQLQREGQHYAEFYSSDNDEEDSVSVDDEVESAFKNTSTL